MGKYAIGITRYKRVKAEDSPDGHQGYRIVFHSSDELEIDLADDEMINRLYLLAPDGNLLVNLPILAAQTFWKLEQRFANDAETRTDGPGREGLGCEVPGAIRRSGSGTDGTPADLRGRPDGPGENRQGQEPPLDVPYPNA